MFFRKPKPQATEVAAAAAAATPRHGYRRLEGPGLATVHVLGGAHISKESARAAGGFIAALKPDTLLLELCDGRANLLDPKLDAPPRPLPPLGAFVWAKPLRALNPLFWLVELPTAGFEAISDSPNGAEMRAALRAAQAVGVQHIELVDRPVQITVLRAAAAAAAALDPTNPSSSWWGGGGGDGSDEGGQGGGEQGERPGRDGVLDDAFGLGSALGFFLKVARLGWRAGGFGFGEGGGDGGGDGGGGSEEGALSGGAGGVAEVVSDEEYLDLQVEAKALIGAMLAESESGGGLSALTRDMGAASQAFFHAVGAERDRLLGLSCHQAAASAGPGKHVVAVVGAAHVPGMAREWAALVRGTVPQAAPPPPPTQRSSGQQPPPPPPPPASSPLPPLALPALAHPTAPPVALYDARRGAYSGAYLAQMDALYDFEAPRNATLAFAAKMLAADLAVVGAGVLAFRAARRAGGTWATAATYARRLGVAASCASTAAVGGGLALGYAGVRALQAKRAEDGPRLSAAEVGRLSAAAAAPSQDSRL